MKKDDDTGRAQPWAGFQAEDANPAWTGFHPAPPGMDRRPSKQTRKAFSEAVFQTGSTAKGVSPRKGGRPRSNKKGTPQPRHALNRIIEAAKAKRHFTDKEIVHAAQLSLATFYRVKQGQYGSGSDKEHAIKRACLEWLKCGTGDVDFDDDLQILKLIAKVK
jgi:hypothetical protein